VRQRRRYINKLASCLFEHAQSSNSAPGSLFFGGALPTFFFPGHRSHVAVEVRIFLLMLSPDQPDVRFRRSIVKRATRFPQLVAIRSGRKLEASRGTCKQHKARSCAALAKNENLDP
jgi:hypothetical protein